MKRKEIEKCLKILDKYKYDEQKNFRSDIMEIIRLLEIERLLRVGQSAAYLDNIRGSSEYPW
jgi:hypothetical protein